jgi:ABC-type cobalamin/Fe3+-siderophores transport system ATPase subunit
MSTLVADGVMVGAASRPILDRVSVRIEPGTCTVIVGPNGAGKTTLLRVLAGLLAPDQGTVTLDGTNLAAFSPRARARVIGFLNASHALVASGATVTDLLDIAAYPWRSRSAKPATSSIARDQRRADRLSDGELAAVWLATIDVQRTPVVLLDEPAVHLDLAHQVDVARWVRRRVAGGAAVALVTHDLDTAVALGDRIVVLSSGRVIADTAAASLPIEVLEAAFATRLHEVVLDGRRRIVPRHEAFRP